MNIDGRADAAGVLRQRFETLALQLSELSQLMRIYVPIVPIELPGLL